MSNILIVGSRSRCDFSPQWVNLQETCCCRHRKEYQITVKSNLVVCDFLYGFCCSFRRRRKEDDSRVSSSPGPGPAVVNSPRGPQFDLEDDAFPPLPGLEASLPQPPPVPVEPPPEINQPASASQSHRENRSLEQKINFTVIFWGGF